MKLKCSVCGERRNVIRIETSIINLGGDTICLKCLLTDMIIKADKSTMELLKKKLEEVENGEKS